MINLELVSDFYIRGMNSKKTESKIGIVYVDDVNDRTTAMTEDIYSLCFITCIKP